MVAHRHIFLQYIWVKYEDVYFFIFVWWHKDIYFYNIFGLNMKMFISLSLRGGTKTYIYIYIYIYILKYIWVKYEDVYSSIFVWWYKDVHFCIIFGFNIKMFKYMCFDNRYVCLRQDMCFDHT